jgi:tripeptide aminopeptidase
MPAGINLASNSDVAALAELRPIRECFAFFTREKTWIQEQHVALCRIAAPTFLEEKRAAWMVEQFRALGCTAEIDRAGNVVAWPRPDGGEPLIAVTAHLDTVLAPRNKDEILVEPDGKLCGPGVSDNGVGLAALLTLARALKSSPPFENSAARIVLIANVCEEGEGNLSGMRYLAAQSPLAERIAAYVVLDGPSLERITHEALASRRFEVLITGPGGHSWSDYGIPNPIHALSHAISWFTGQVLPAPEGNGPRWSFNFGTIEGGSSVNSIPAQARAKVDLRAREIAKIGEMAGILSSAVDRGLQVENERATTGRLSARVKEIGSRPGGLLPEDATILRSLLAVDTYLGIRGHLECASTDANIPLSLGIPALSIGAGGQGGGAHTPSEWFHPEGRDLGLKRIVLLLAALTVKPG